MKAADLMSPPPAVVRAETPTGAARALAADHGVEALPVLDADGRLVGVVAGTEGRRDQERDEGPAGGARGVVAEVMTSPAIGMPPDATVGALARVMLAHRLRLLPIVEDGALLGVVDRDDLLATLVHDDDVIASRIRGLLRDYAELRRWGVHVVAGAATVSGAFLDRADRTVVVSLVGAVPGVVSVELRMEHPIATGSAG